MNCKETEKYIAKFINDSLDEDEMDAFIKHVEKCAACKEELTIQYLVSIGMNRLEEGGTFDLRGELDNKLFKNAAKIKFHRQKYSVYFALELAFICAIAIVTIFFLY